jgi:hypothetical protein
VTRRAKITKGKKKIIKKTLKPVKRKKPDKTDRTAEMKKALKRMSTKRTIINAVHK